MPDVSEVHSLTYFIALKGRKLSTSGEVRCDKKATRVSPERAKDSVTIVIRITPLQGFVKLHSYITMDCIHRYYISPFQGLHLHFQLCAVKDGLYLSLLSLTL
jgi:hypothetical protein